jgi:DNA modification methylase
MRPLTMLAEPPCRDIESPSGRLAGATPAVKVTRSCGERGGLPPDRAGTGGVVSKSGNGSKAPANKLFFGDNLSVLREEVPTASVDLVYLDPPFNSQARYNVLFQSPVEDVASAQVGAFLDFWSWHTGEAENAYHEIMTKVGGQTATFIAALRSALGESDMMAYLVMMALRLVELRRILKPTGSIYLHCDPTASHYLKILLDGIFGPDRFQSEVVWKRTSAHNSAKRWGPIHDTILFYSASEDFTWENTTQPYDQEYIDAFFVHEDPDGRRWRRADLTGSGIRHVTVPTGEATLRVHRGEDASAQRERCGDHHQQHDQFRDVANAFRQDHSPTALRSDSPAFVSSGGAGAPFACSARVGGGPIANFGPCSISRRCRATSFSIMT